MELADHAHPKNRAQKTKGPRATTRPLLFTACSGSPTWTRTRDLRINSPSLYQLSYQGSEAELYTPIIKLSRCNHYCGKKPGADGELTHSGTLAWRHIANHPPQQADQLIDFALLETGQRFAIALDQDIARRAQQPGLTLIGDAAHLMSPFGGEGANGAMADAADLALLLARGDDWREAVVAYENLMFPRAEVAASGAGKGLQGAVAAKQPTHIVRHLQQ